MISNFERNRRMAGDWLQWTKGLSNKREVVVMAAILKRDRDEVAGKVMRFWEWCDDNVTEQMIDRETGSAVINLSPSRDDNMAFVDSIIGLQGFAAAMGEAGWLSFRSSGIGVPNFVRHNGATAKTRARNAKNQANRRAANVTEPVLQMSPANGDKCHRQMVTKEEKRRVKEVEHPPDVPVEYLPDGTLPQEKARAPEVKRAQDVPIPPELDSTGFRDAWARWLKHRSEKKKHLGVTAAEEQLRKLKAIGPERAEEAIRHSIAQGWQGVFEPKGDRMGTHPRPRHAGEPGFFDGLAAFAAEGVGNGAA